MSAHPKAAITFQALAQRLEVSVKRVSSAIARGEIRPDYTAKTKDGKRTRTIITDADGAESDLRKALEIQAPQADEPVDVSGVDFDNPETWPNTLSGLRAVKEHHVTRAAKIKADLAMGQLAKVDDVRRDFFEASRTIRDHLQNLPERIAHDLAAELGVQEVDPVRRLLREGIDRGLEDLANALRKWSPAG